ncbi:MAG: DMT family transporter [Gaiellaceae bacterium]
MLTAPLALAASVSWGVGDFLGGLKSRLIAPLSVMAVAQPVGLTLLALAVAARAKGPPGPAMFWACLAAVLGTTGLFAFYRGMAAGALSIVAPIAGAGATLPVAWGLAHGDHPSGLQELGFAAALIGVVAASWERRPGAARLASGVGWAVLAMLAFGGYYVPMHAASRGDFLWASFLFRTTSTSLVYVAWLLARPSFAPRAQLLPLAAIGILDTGGNVLFAASSAHGIVSVVSVLASLYPVVTVLLARLVLGERVQRSQELGVALALTGVVLVSTG